MTSGSLSPVYCHHLAKADKSCNQSAKKEKLEAVRLTANQNEEQQNQNTHTKDGL